jgi:hypothetical protein
MPGQNDRHPCPRLLILLLAVAAALALVAPVIAKSIPPPDSAPILNNAKIPTVNGHPLVFGSSDRDFTDFQQRHSRTYRTTSERQARQAIFKSNVDYVNKHNAEFLEGRKT